MSAMQDVATGLGSECELVGSLSWQVGFLCAECNTVPCGLQLLGVASVNLVGWLTDNARPHLPRWRTCPCSPARSGRGQLQTRAAQHVVQRTQSSHPEAGIGDSFRSRLSQMVPRLQSISRVSAAISAVPRGEARSTWRARWHKSAPRRRGPGIDEIRIKSSRLPRRCPPCDFARSFPSQRFSLSARP